MKLQDFIKETLVGLVQGIEDASKELGNRAFINPKGTASAGAGFGGNIGVVSITVGGSQEKAASSGSVSRLAFDIPIVLPQGNSPY